MADNYDFGNLSPIEFEALIADLMSAELGVHFETFSEGADGGIDARYSTAKGNLILQAKHYKGSTWSDLKSSATKESPKIRALKPIKYYFVTSQKLTPTRKDDLKKHLNHSSVTVSNILGRAELNALLQKHDDVERRNIKLWLSSTSVLQRLLNNDIAVFTEATKVGIERILKVFVANPSLPKAAKILEKQHCLIVSGPPGVGKTTLAQVLAAEYCEDGWELVAISSIEEGNRAFHPEKRQVFIFDDFLGKIKLDDQSLAKDDAKITTFMKLVSGRDTKRFILTTRKYILQSARTVSEALDDDHVELTEMVLDLSVYTREIKARILYNHLYHSSLKGNAIDALLKGNTVTRIVDHPHYMPRIVEWMTDHLQFRDAKPSEYPKSFLQALDNPEKIWKKPFNNHISSEARVLLFCMYFSRPEGIYGSGITLAKLHLFFKRALVAFDIKGDSSVREVTFEDTLREIKSSFIVLQGGKVNFINPSVQDFLARQVDDKRILKKLACSIATLENAADLWGTTLDRFNDKPNVIVQVAHTILTTLQSGDVGGRMALEDLANLLGELLLKANKPDFVHFLRRGGLANNFWINDFELPNLIDDLMFGKFHELQYAPTLGRWLRLRLFKYLSQREYVLEIEELGQLADNLEMYREDLPECIQEKFEEAATESIDFLDASGIAGHEDRESAIGGWIEQMDKIESYLGRSVDSWKRDLLEKDMWEYQQLHEQQMQEMKDEGGLRRSANSVGGATQQSSSNRLGLAGSDFSNVDLGNMFLSLKK